jgi:hypothetical protein
MLTMRLYLVVTVVLLAVKILQLALNSVVESR